MKNTFWILAFMTVLIWGAYDEMREVQQQASLPVAVAK